MDSPLHHLAHRALFFPPPVQLNGASNNIVVIQLLERCSWSPQPFVHVLQAKQFHKQASF